MAAPYFGRLLKLGRLASSRHLRMTRRRHCGLKRTQRASGERRQRLKKLPCLRKDVASKLLLKMSASRSVSRRPLKYRNVGRPAQLKNNFARRQNLLKVAI